MDRITQKDLEYLADRVNQITESPAEYSTRDDKGTRTTNIGNYHLNYAYGGVKLVRTCTAGGGINDISSGGYGTKRELYNWIHAFMSGLDY